MVPPVDSRDHLPARQQQRCAAAMAHARPDPAAALNTLTCSSVASGSVKQTDNGTSTPYGIVPAKSATNTANFSRPKVENAMIADRRESF